MIDFDSFQAMKPLKGYTTFGIGGPAKYFIEVKEVAVMQEVILFCKKHQLPFFILGKGSNLLFDDKGFAGVVIANRIDFIQKPDACTWHVGAGYSFSLLGSQTARQGYAGLEFASGIPGSVGGAVYMNAGANGGEASQALISVDFVTPDGVLHILPKEELKFSYRFSSFQKRRGAIVGATFKLTPSSEAREKQLSIIQHRKNTQPLNAKSAGCVFRNPSCGHAGALIDQSGLKGHAIGGAAVSTMHANFVINASDASAKDIVSLIDHIQKKVKEHAGIELESEVRVIPYSPLEVDEPHE